MKFTVEFEDAEELAMFMRFVNIQNKGKERDKLRAELEEKWGENANRWARLARED